VQLEEDMDQGQQPHRGAQQKQGKQDC
jgi:hypothetical protein